MFRWAIIFAVIALLASFLGFGGVAGLSANFGKYRDLRGYWCALR